MSDKRKRETHALASKLGISYQAAHNLKHRPQFEYAEIGAFEMSVQVNGFQPETVTVSSETDSMIIESVSPFPQAPHLGDHYEDRLMVVKIIDLLHTLWVSVSGQLLAKLRFEDGWHPGRVRPLPMEDFYRKHLGLVDLPRLLQLVDTTGASFGKNVNGVRVPDPDSPLNPERTKSFITHRGERGGDFNGQRYYHRWPRVIFLSGD